MKIKYQQFLILLLTSIVLFSVLSFFIYFYQRQVLLNQIYSHLESIAEAKEIRIKGIIKTAKEMITFPANNSSIIDNLKKSNTIPDKAFLKDISEPLKRYVFLIPSFNKIHITNLTGRIIASSDSGFIGKDFSTHEAFTIPASGQKYLDGFHYTEQNELNVFLSSPIFSDGNLLGAMIIESDADNILSLTNDYAGLGETGESTLGKRYGDSVTYLTPLRFDPNGALKRKIPVSNTSFAMARAVSNQEGLIKEGVDYLGNKVIAVARHIPESNWGMTVKINEQEAMNPVHHLRNVLILFNLGALILAVIAALIAGNYLAKPINEIIDKTNKIREGDLSVRVTTPRRNELGTLADSFNHMTERLQMKIQQLDKYAYMISHDLKAPLAAIQGLIPFLKEYDKKTLDEEGKEMLAMVEAKSAEMSLMVDNILKSAKQQSKQTDYINLLHLAQEVVETLNPPDNFHIFIQHTLPTVKFSRTSMAQILQNLVSNAIKYMDKEQPLVKVSSIEYNRYFKICVEDNGRGIEEDKLACIFEMFEVAHCDTRIDSHGIGLSIVKQLVEESGGKVWAESVPGEGSKFHFTIPK